MAGTAGRNGIPGVREKDCRCRWDDGEIIDRIKEEFPPDHALGLFASTARRIRDALAFAGLEASPASSQRAHGAERSGRR